jgi:hypothetical protein
MKAGYLCIFMLMVCMSPPALGTTLTGYIEVNDPFHFISDTPNEFGEYVITMDTTSELIVSFDSSISPFSMTEVNAAGFGNDPEPYPYIGGITGVSATSSDMAIGSYNYAALGETTATVPNSPPVNGSNSFTDSTGFPEPIESAIWGLSSDDVLSPQWINSDLSQPSTFVVDSGGILALTGDATQFQNLFGGNADTLVFICTAGCSTEAAIPETSTFSMALCGAAAMFIIGRPSIRLRSLLRK